MDDPHAHRQVHVAIDVDFCSDTFHPKITFCSIWLSKNHERRQKQPKPIQGLHNTKTQRHNSYPLGRGLEIEKNSYPKPAPLYAEFSNLDP
jgi:hypothetical protein